MVKYFAPPNWASISSITGSRNEFDFVTWFSFLKSTQNWLEPPFLLLSKSGKLHGEFDLSMIYA